MQKLFSVNVQNIQFIGCWVNNKKNNEVQFNGKTICTANQCDYDTEFK